ncbi:calcium-binding and coiled-coil domain-containing protein 1 isoform X2 [Scleropages formosus]|uniref:Calcium binding and coiled-coil domain 1a n=2 Tax=Scleropages formosus TaxID=113540 RepID=A0A8C9TRH0_SCLFO|nr:calcium-binding and coiled-coil domain-containing protein 1-like isoform X2 [Scleropages formosus]XP_029102214.1 calcium-binding and coiled-coil domain-containing protein 1-like isoform X2 [Scleropages formosus]XP_029102215.1 calcium-binding and coiled-coil domain-containing protein 1-like isoform X2 [Scleropages formosus]
MEKTWKVEFRNVGQSYFPQSRVECHYSLSPQHMWTSSDWIGLFKVGWSSVRDYHTFVWAVAPAGYQEGTAVNCCVQFQASYLPGPSTDPFQFVYVDGKGAICARSSHFTFCAPKPLEDLVTLEEEGHEEEEGADLLLVVPRAELLQSRLEECLRERSELLQAREVAERAQERERHLRERAKEDWDRARGELEESIAKLKEKLRQSQEKIEEMEKKQQEAQFSHEAMIMEKDSLMAQIMESQQRIKALEDEAKALAHRGTEKEAELERMKERIKKMTAQKWEEEEERKTLQDKLQQSEEELRSLAAEFQGLRSSLAQRDMQALQLRDTITTLTSKLHAAQKKEAECEAALCELQSLQERLAASEHTAEGLKAELSAMAARRDQAQAEVHQARLQAAQLTLQLAEASLALREGRAAWAQEREALQQSAQADRERVEKQSAELQRKEEWLQEERMEREKVEVELGKEKDCSRVQLSEARRELQELKASLRVAQKEKEHLLLEKQEMMDYMRQLEQRLDAVADAKWSEAAFASVSRPDSPVSDSEDENPEALRHRPPHPLGPYGLCDPPPTDALLLGTPPPSPRELSRGTVVVSQPAPLSSPRQTGSDTLTHSSDSEEDLEMGRSSGQSSGEETALLLPDHRDTVLSELAGSPLW